MIPLEVTHTALATPSVLSRLITGTTSLATAASTSSSEGDAGSGSPFAGPIANPLASSNHSSWSLHQHHTQHQRISGGNSSSSSSEDGSSSSSGRSRSSSVDFGDEGRLTGGYAASPFKLLVEQLLTFFASTYRSVFKFQDPPLHDPCAVAYVIAPEIFQVG